MFMISRGGTKKFALDGATMLKKKVIKKMVRSM